MKTILLTILALAITALPSRAAMIGVRYANNSSAPNVISINETNAQVTVLATATALHMNALAGDRNGNIWTSGITSDSFTNRLFKVDPLTGQTIPGAVITVPSGYSATFDGMAFSPSNVLYAIETNDNLLTVDTTTGVATLVGRVGVLGQPIGIQGLAFAPDGTLYGWGLQLYGLIRINPATAAFTDVSAAAGPSDLQALAFGPDGTLYGARGSLYKINTTTAARTLIGSGLGDIRGIDFVTVPEPSTIGASIVAALAFAGYSVRKKKQN